MNSTFGNNNHQWKKFVDENFTHARSADNQQIVDSTAADVTSLVLPAIGAILMLVFGGILLSSTSCCNSDKGERKKNNEDYEGIDFTFLSGSIVFPRLSPVLQQENNDVVEAVMATYSDLPQYGPAHDELAAIAGATTVTKPKTRNVCLSPIHETNQVTIPGNTEDETDPPGLQDIKTVTQQPGSDSEERWKDVEAPSVGSRDGKRLASSVMEVRNLSDQNDHALHRSKSTPLETTHDKNTNQEAPSLDERCFLDASRDSDDSYDVEGCSTGSRDSYSKTCDGDSLSGDRMTSPATELQVHKWIGEILPEQGATDASYKWKRRDKLSKKDKLEILKRLQPTISDGTVHKVMIDEKQPDIKRENINNQSCKGSSPDSAVVLTDGPCAKGGRFSRLKVIRAPSALCIHGNQCHAHCRTTGHVTEGDNHLNDSGRGASCFAESCGHSSSVLRGASAFGDPTRGASVFGEPLDSRDSKSRDLALDSHHLTKVRGASSFGGTELYSNNKCQPLEDVRTYGETTSCWMTGVSVPATNDIRGASGFGESCDRLSVAGTASVTLSMAVQSEKEDFLEDNDNPEGKTERTLVEQVDVTNNEQGGGKRCCSKMDKQNTRERTLEPKKRVCLDSKANNVEATSIPRHDDIEVGSLRDNNIKKKSIEVIQSRDEDEPNRASTPKDVTTDPQMSLGKDPRALSGLLKALRREKLKKTSKTKEELPPISSVQNECPPFRENTEVNENLTQENTYMPDAMKKDGRRMKQLVGKIKVCLFYTRSDTDKPVLYATVLKAYSLRPEYVKPKEDFLVEMLVSTRDNSTQKSNVIKEYKNSLVFNHLFHVSSIKTRELQISALKLMLVSGRSHECVGIANVPLGDLVSRDKIKKTYLLRRPTSASCDIPSTSLSTPVPVGAVCVGLKYNSVEEKLLVHVIKVRGLPEVSSNGETDPYVIVTLEDHGKTIVEKMTLTKWQQRNPAFDFKYVFELSSNKVETSSLLLRVMNNAANHSLIGTVKIGMDSLEDSGRCHWNNIVTKPGMLEERWHKLINKSSDIKIQR